MLRFQKQLAKRSNQSENGSSDHSSVNVVIEVELDTLQIRDLPDFTAHDDLEEVIINDAFPEQKIKIGGQLSREEMIELVKHLRDNMDVFAWEVTDMRGVKEEVEVHHLKVDATIKPIQQRARSFSPEKEAAIKVEVDKLLKAGIIRELQYPSWLANAVMVKKSNGKWMMCMDFTDLNKACPKDCYPLPHIDQ